jgi:hypothetical protein
VNPSRSIRIHVDRVNTLALFNRTLRDAPTGLAKHG